MFVVKIMIDSGISFFVGEFDIFGGVGCVVEFGLV